MRRNAKEYRKIYKQMKKIAKFRGSWRKTFCGKKSISWFESQPRNRSVGLHSAAIGINFGATGHVQCPSIIDQLYIFLRVTKVSIINLLSPHKFKLKTHRNPFSAGPLPRGHWGWERTTRCRPSSRLRRGKPSLFPSPTVQVVNHILCPLHY